MLRTWSVHACAFVASGSGQAVSSQLNNLAQATFWDPELNLVDFPGNPSSSLLCFPSSSSSSSAPSSSSSSSNNNNNTSSSSSSSSSSSPINPSSSTSSPTPTHQIVIDLDNTVQDSPDAIKAEVTELLSQNVTVTGVEVVVDSSTGQVVQVVVNISATQDQAQALVNNILSSSKEESCAAGVLCRITDVYLDSLTSGAWAAQLSTMLLVGLLLLAATPTPTSHLGEPCLKE